jgi:putative flippase GtrA
MSRFHKIGKYVSVALLSAGSDWLLFSIMISLLGAPHVLSLIVSRICGGVVSFLSNRYWTWGGNRKIALTQQGRRFLMLCGASYAFSIAQFYLLHTTVGLSAYSAKLATDCSCFILNYLVMNVYVFHHSGSPAVPLHSLVNRSDRA